MKALFIGGSGILSSACARRALEQGIELTVLTRGQSDELRPFPQGVQKLRADTRDRASYSRALEGRDFDVVVNFIAFLPEHIELDVELFSARVNHYIFVSSASVYQKPIQSWPITEQTPRENRFWQYARDKIACEERLMKAIGERAFPATIVRPSHTYDRTLLPFGPHGAGATTLDRIRAGRPIVIHGDGTSLWTLTHHDDFAVGLVGLFGKSEALGEDFHITSDRAQSWDQIARIFGRLASVEPDIVHVPSDLIARYHAEWGASLLGDKAHSALFDNSKIRRVVPEFAPRISFETGAEDVFDFYAHAPRELGRDASVDRLIDELAARFSVARSDAGSGWGR